MEASEAILGLSWKREGSTKQTLGRKLQLQLAVLDTLVR